MTTADIIPLGQGITSENVALAPRVVHEWLGKEASANDKNNFSNIPHNQYH